MKVKRYAQKISPPLEIRCARCGDTWPIPVSLSQDQLLGLANHAAHHKCVIVDYDYAPDMSVVEYVGKRPKARR